MIMGKPIYLSTNLRVGQISRNIVVKSTRHITDLGPCGQKIATLEFRITCFMNRLLLIQKKTLSLDYLLCN